MGEKLLTKQADVNISVATSSQATGKKYFPEFESVVVNNGINQDRFNPRLHFKNVRQELGIREDEIVALFIARFIHQKQPIKLVKAFIKAAPQLNTLRLLMVGDGDQQAEAIELAKESGLGDRIIFQSFRQDVPDVLAAADIFVLPSLWEGLPIGLLEAMAMGKAIIGTQVDGTSEVIHPHENGLLLSLENLEDNLAAAIIELATDPVTRQHLGEAAKATVTKKFSAANMTRQIEDIYLKLLNNK